MPTINNAPEVFSVVSALIVAFSSGLILIMSLAIVSRMDSNTDHFIRIYYTTLAAGAFYELLWVLVSRSAFFGETLICASVAIGMVFDRRTKSRSHHREQPCP